MSNVAKMKRNSSVELLKIIAMFLIVLSHTVPSLTENILNMGGGVETYPDYVIDVRTATANIQYLIVSFFKYFGQIGNAIFVVCSAYFLCDSKKVSGEKIISIVLDSFTVSVIWLCVTLMTGCNIYFSDLITALAPITGEACWFVGCYILYYAIHPALNWIIDKMAQKQLLLVNISMTILYFCVNTVWRERYYYTDLVGFIGIYFCVAYSKKYTVKTSGNMKVNKVGLILSFVLLFLLFLASNYLGVHISFLADKLIMRWSTYINPLIVIFAFGAFNIANYHKIYVPWVNYISGMSLLLYIIHENVLFREYIRLNIFKWIYTTYSYEHVIIWIFTVAFILFIGTLIVCIVYHLTLQRLTKRLSQSIYYFLNKVFNLIAESLFKIN